MEKETFSEILSFYRHRVLFSWDQRNSFWLSTLVVCTDFSCTKEIIKNNVRCLHASYYLIDLYFHVEYSQLSFSDVPFSVERLCRFVDYRIIHRSDIVTSLLCMLDTDCPRASRVKMTVSVLCAGLGLGASSTGRRDSFDRNTSAFSPSLEYSRAKWPQSYGALGKDRFLVCERYSDGV